MFGWILIGEKSAALKDLDIFVNTFNNMGVPLVKIFAEDVAVISNNNEGTLYVNGEKMTIPNFAVSAFFGDNTYHNRSVVRMLESIGVLCINNCECLINTGDKLRSFQLIHRLVPSALLPKTMLYDSALTENIISENLSFPLIAKINHGAKGSGVSLVDNYDDLIKRISEYNVQYKDEILLQEYISCSKGKDLRIILCGGEYITSFIRINKTDFKSNLALGGYLEFFTPPQGIIETALEIGRALSINLGSVDFLLGSNNQYFVCEANSMPGLSYVKAAKENGIKNPLELIVENIQIQVENIK